MRAGLHETTKVYVEKREPNPFDASRRTPDLPIESHMRLEEEPIVRVGPWPSGAFGSTVGVGRIGGWEAGRRGAGVPDLRFLGFQGLELISGDLKRFKGVSLDLKSKPFERERVNHLSPGLAINCETKRGIRVTQNLNTPDRGSDGF